MNRKSNRGNPVLVQEQQQVEAPGSQLVLPYQFTGVSIGATTPSVKNITRLKFQNSAPVLVLDFKNGQEGQEIKILGDGNTTLQNNSQIITNTGIDKPMVINNVYTFTRFNDAWVEEECCASGTEGGSMDGGFPGAIYGGTSPTDGGGP